MIIDSLRYWVREMHVDGFRFDLASILSRDETGQPLKSPPVLWDIETDPVLAFSPELYYPKARRAKRQNEPLPVVPPPDTVLRLAADSSLTPRFERIQLVGADGSWEVAGFTVRGEAAWGKDRLLPRSVQELVAPDNVQRAVGGPARQARIAQKFSLGGSVPLDLGDLFATSDTVEWGVGVDHVFGAWMPLVQVNQTIVLDDVPTLLIEDVDTQFLFALRRAFFDERLGTEVAVVQSVSRGYTVGIGQADGTRIIFSCFLIPQT